MKKKIVFIAPHLSTGGMPQYLVKQIESIKKDLDIYCIEWENITGGVLVVQRNKMVNLLGDRLITLGENKHELFDILTKLQPDIVHLQEIPELFMPREISDKLYTKTRRYAIIETSHDSGYDLNNKIHLPDKFLMVSNYQKVKYDMFGIPCDIVEYPIENKIRTKTREQALTELGLDPNLKHVINVGLFTPRKNQAEIVEYARLLQHYPIQFHFIGNQADNFKFYWEPIMKQFPRNCIWWNERSDVDAFYEAADLFLFTSRGNDSDRETMPLVIREALSWKVPSLIYNLPVYMGYFDKYKTIEYLTENVQQNAYRIAEKLLRDTPISIDTTPPKSTDCIIITTYPTTTAAEGLTKECILHARQFGLPIILTSHCEVSEELQNIVDYCIVDKNNILTKHTHYNVSWYEHPDFYASINLKGEGNDVYHGPAVQTNYYNGITLAKGLGFVNAYCLNYDVWIKDKVFIDKMRTALQSSGLISHIYREEEGMCVKTVLFGTNVEFFLNNFPRILTEEEYTSWMKEIGSESNGLENMWYNNLKHQIDSVASWTEEEYKQITQLNQMDMCSLIEYHTVLPIENDSNNVMIWFSSNNTVDKRILKVYVNNELHHTEEITSHPRCYIPVPLSTTKTVMFELLDADKDKTIYTKTVEVDWESIKNNGVFRYNK